MSNGFTSSLRSFFIASDGSRCQIGPADNNATRQVSYGGPRALWTTVEDAHREWRVVPLSLNPFHHPAAADLSCVWVPNIRPGMLNRRFALAVSGFPDVTLRFWEPNGAFTASVEYEQAVATREGMRTQRVHGNFAEYVPLALLLLALIKSGSETVLGLNGLLFGIVIIVAGFAVYAATYKLRVRGTSANAIEST